ncbi:MULTISPECIES: Fis family transcriptional regulator [Amycolatopsis]|uniref:Fis family transcriptional regulator n=1 Tax=Amycolatopsis albidoflavus TaxID=102226 RepID=A0ABW5IA34_9PSEU
MPPRLRTLGQIRETPVLISVVISVQNRRSDSMLGCWVHELPASGSLNPGAEMTHPIPRPAHFDHDAASVIIEQLSISDRDVTREAQRWITGERGPLVEDPGQLAAADLTNYVTEAIRIGAHALSVTGQAQEAQAIERLLKDVGDKTADSTARAAELTQRAVREASDVVTKAARDAKTAITEADVQSRTEFTTAVSAAKKDLHDEVRRIFAGDNPELVERLRPLLDKFSTDLGAKLTTGTTELLATAAQQFDASDPTSPMAKHAAELAARQEQLAQQLSKQHTELAGKIDEVSTALRVQEARTSLAKVTPIKGDSYANQLHAVLATIASGLGDDYSDTSSAPGNIPRCKKGDGVLSLNDGTVRVVIEMTDSSRAGWTAYLEDAERNRDAAASLGLVRTAEQNSGQTIRVLGSQRVILAFDPTTDDPNLLRTVVMLLRTTAIATSGRKGVQEIATAEDKITEALTHLAKIDSVKKLSATIQKSATKIDSECATLNAAIQRLLDEALIALDGADAGAASSAASTDQHGAA